jgi:hypothetical protein
VRYATLDEVRRKAPVMKHAAFLDATALFASGARPPDGIANQAYHCLVVELSTGS